MLLVALGAILLLPALTYSGLCLSEMRYLSDDEKIRVAVSRVIEVLDARNRALANAGSEKDAMNQGPLAYHSVDKFLELNPNCCAVNDFGPEGIGPPTFLQRLLGIYSTVVEVHFRDSYAEADGFTWKTWQVGLSVCGRHVKG